jgi:hypothetical protein
MTKKIDIERTKQLVHYAVERYPNRRNPAINGDACVYTSVNGTSHCIAGQVIVDAGHNAPDVNEVMTVTDCAIFKRTFTVGSLRYLEIAQAIFDGRSVYHFSFTLVRGTRSPRKWSSAIKILDDITDKFPVNELSTLR